MKPHSITPYISACVTAGALVLGVTGALILHAGAVKNEPDCDFIIVLGHRERDGRFGATLDERIHRASAYLRSHPHTKAILSGGNGEARYMRQALTAAGIDENRLITEEKSTLTWQNLKYSLPLTDGVDSKRVGILSSEFHLFRTKMYLKSEDIPMISAKTKDFPRWLYNFCREIAGVWHYVFLGGTYDQQYLR